MRRNKSLYVDNIDVALRMRRLFWAFAYTFLFKVTPRWKFHAWRILLLRLFGATIGMGCKIAPSVKIWAPWNMTLGNFVAIGEGVDFYAMDMITVGSHVAISQRSFICSGTHDIRYLSRPLVTKPIVIQDYAWICAEAFVGPGVIVGVGAVVAARACVVRDVDNWSIVAGNPARFVKKRVVEEASLNDE